MFHGDVPQGRGRSGGVFDDIDEEEPRIARMARISGTGVLGEKWLRDINRRNRRFRRAGVKGSSVGGRKEPGRPRPVHWPTYRDGGRMEGFKEHRRAAKSRLLAQQ